jgi:MFS family permease
VLLVTDPAWSVFGAYWAVYMPLYLSRLGAGPALIGWVSAAGLGIQAVASLAGGPLADRWPWIRVVTAFDGLAWVLPFALWYAVPRLWAAVLAQLLTVVSMIVVPAWNALLLDEAEPAQRPQLLALLQLAVFLPALPLPLLGRAIAHHGVVPVSRAVFGGSWLAVTAAWLVRAVTIPPRPPARRGGTPAPPAQAYREVLRGFLRPEALAVWGVGLAATVRGTLWSSYAPLLWVAGRGLGLPGASLTALSALGAAVSAAVSLLALPHLARAEPRAVLATGQAAVLVASALLAAAPAHEAAWPVLAWAVAAAGAALVFPAQTGLWYNLFPRERFTALQAVTGAATTVAAAPLGPLFGALFAVNPRLPFWVHAALQAAALGLALLPVRRRS